MDKEDIIEALRFANYVYKEKDIRVLEQYQFLLQKRIYELNKKNK